MLCTWPLSGLMRQMAKPVVCSVSTAKSPDTGHQARHAPGLGRGNSYMTAQAKLSLKFSAIDNRLAQHRSY